MRNIKCIIGATILTPLIAAAFFAFLFGLGWFIHHFPMLSDIVGGILILILLALLWLGIYVSCVSHKEEQANQRIDTDHRKKHGAA